MSEGRQHAAVANCKVRNDELIIGGVPISQLATRIGQTPFYAYDREAMTRSVGELRKAMPEQLSIHYAVKANPMPAVVAHLYPLVDGLDIASLGEMKVALDLGARPTDISFAGPGKRELELSAAVAAGVTVNLESPRELERIATAGERLGIKPRVALRINPDFELRSSGMKMGGGPKQFGIDAERVPAVLRRIGELDLSFRGFHVYSGSQNLSSEHLVDTQNATFDLVYHLAEHAPAPMAWLNIGGGFGIPYFPGERHLDLEPIGANLERRIRECHERLGETEVVLELGRYLVGPAGYYVCRVIERKESRGQTFLVTDGGLHHHLAATGNFGQIIRKNYPVISAGRVFGGERETVSVVGPLCTPLDLLGDRVELGRADEGALIAVLQSGAYGFTASPHRFLSHPAAVETLV